MDHLAQFELMKNVSILLETHMLSRRDYNNFNEQSFLNDLSIQNWRVNSNDPINNFNDFLCIERHVPLKKVNKKEIKFASKP